MTDSRDGETLTLLRRWHRGESGALEELVRRNLGWVVAYVRGALRDHPGARGESADFVQDAMVQILERCPRFEVADEQHFRALIARIVTKDIQDDYRFAHRQRRDRKRERPIPTDSVLYLDRPIDSVTRPSQSLQAEERRAWIRLGIELMEPHDREILRLRQWDDASFAEIGERLGVSEDAARMRHNRAVGRLTRKVVELRSGDLSRLLG